jgi:predicted membrane GTPase involved in stress response
VNEVFDLLVELGADDEALDFPVIFASARDGWSSEDHTELRAGDLRPIFEAIVEHVPPAEATPDEPLRMLVTTLDYSEYVGRIGIGRVFQGTIRSGARVAIVDRDGDEPQGEGGRAQAVRGARARGHGGGRGGRPVRRDRDRGGRHRRHDRRPRRPRGRSPRCAWTSRR